MLIFLPRATLSLCLLLACAAPAARAGEPAWDKAKAAAYLDERLETWFAFGSADRGTGATKTSCVCCHTVVPHALARPALRRLTGDKKPTALEERLHAQTKLRVENWAALDTPKFALLYGGSAQRKKESRGTEAVLNALMLAFTDRHQGRTTPGEHTTKAFANLWAAQTTQGDDAGSWDWLNFGLEPWEAPPARYFGAGLAAVAVGTAPGYYKPGTDAATDKHVDALRGYLKGKFAGQNLYNRGWALWASMKLDGVLAPEQQKQVLADLFAKQRADGGWNLASLGDYQRVDKSARHTASDGYATALALNMVQTAGVPKSDARVAKGLTWLRTNQAATGEWRGVSVNKNRGPTTHTGLFMSDAATGYAVLALGP